MATNPMNPTPFFGSKISLISKSEIRYEGILYTVDPKESTIALAQVRSFGSEERIVDKPVPPRDEIFQYIIFRASDIKDLIVDQPPSPALTDPAIIQAPSSINTGQSSSSIQQLQAGIQNAAAAAAAASLSKSASQQSAPVTVSVQNLQDNKTNKSTSSNVQQAVASSSSGSQTSKQANKQGQQLQQRNNANQMNRQQHAQHQQNNRTQQDGGQANNFMGNRTNNFNKRINVNTRSPMNGFNQRNGSQNYRGFNNPRFLQRQPTGFNSYNRRQNNRNFVNRQNHQKPTITLPDSDFDFEKAQDEFKQLEEKFASLKVNGDPSEAAKPAVKTEIEASKDPCYNKEKSFFDKISCEALERERGNVQRVDWKAERKLNRETFGVVAPIRLNGYRLNSRFSGGGYRGYRSRKDQRSTSGGHKPNGLSNLSSASASGPSTSTAVASSSNFVSPAKN